MVDFYKERSSDYFKQLVKHNCKCTFSDPQYVNFKIEKFQNIKDRINFMQSNKNKYDNTTIIMAIKHIEKNEIDIFKKRRRKIDNEEEFISDTIKELDDRISELRKTKCEKFIEACLSKKNFIAYTLNDYDEADGDECINRFLYYCFNELLNNYKYFKQVVNNQYTKVIERNWISAQLTHAEFLKELYKNYVEEVKYLQVFENHVKYTIKMTRPTSNTMKISLKATAKPVGGNSYDMNYKVITLHV